MSPCDYFTDYHVSWLWSLNVIRYRSGTAGTLGSQNAHEVVETKLGGRYDSFAYKVAALRRSVAARNQARWLPGNRPQGLQAGEALQPAGQ
jgi:hypothetical protein